MSSDQQRLIAQLSSDLTPVRPILRMRVSLAVVLGLWALLFVGVAWSAGITAGPGALGDPLFVGVLLGQVLAALGGSIAALASGTPGREGLARRGLAAAGAGIVGSLVIAAVLALSSSAAAHPLSAAFMCLRNGLVLAIAPIVGLGIFVARGWVARPLFAAGLASVGAAAFGGMIVHVCCPFSGGAAHVALGHATIPLALVALAIAPLGVLLRRTAR